MDMEQLQELDRINNFLEQYTAELPNYWLRYSSMSTWQFWVMLLFLVGPLVAIFFMIDRKRALLIGFYGFNVHVWFHYADLITTTRGMTGFPFKVIPLIPVNLSLDSSFIPVTFMLIYQWTRKYNKNFYLYALAYSLFLAFLFKPALVAFGLFQISNSMNYFYIFLVFVGVSFISKWITNLFKYFENHPQQHADPAPITTSNKRKYTLNRFFLQRKKAK